MILDRQNLIDQLNGVVGFRQPNNSAFSPLVPSLTETRSGRFYNDANPLITPENIAQTLPDFTGYNYQPYDGVTDANGGYVQGSKVESGGVNYEYIANSPSTGNPPPNTTYWQEINPESDRLLKLVNRGISMVLDGITSQGKMQRGIVKGLLENQIAYQGDPQYTSPRQNQNRFVGLEITFQNNAKSLVTQIRRIGILLEGTVIDLPVYCFHTSKRLPIAQTTITTTETKDYAWTNWSLLLRHADTSRLPGGKYFIGYFQSDLEAQGAKAIEMQYPGTAPQCHVVTNGFEIAENELPAGPLNFDHERAGYTNENYGLNLDYSVKCDLGPLMLEQEYEMSEAIMYGVGMEIVKAMGSATTRTNAEAAYMAGHAEKQTLHHKDVKGTLADLYHNALKAIRFDLSGLGGPCTPLDEPTYKPLAGIGRVKRVW